MQKQKNLNFCERTVSQATKAYTIKNLNVFSFPSFLVSNPSVGSFNNVTIRHGNKMIL